jgi:hypothetical protein
MMHITGKESTNAQENCERKPKKKWTREREREREKWREFKETCAGWEPEV